MALRKTQGGIGKPWLWLGLSFFVVSARCAATRAAGPGYIDNFFHWQESLF
jgi:hypothetical protein